MQYWQERDRPAVDERLTMTPRSPITSLIYRSLNGYAVHQRMQTKIPSIGKCWCFVLYIFIRTLLNAKVYADATMASVNAIEPKFLC